MTSEGSLREVNTTHTETTEEMEFFGFDEKDTIIAEEMPSNFLGEVKTPYYEDNQLLTTISWLDHPLCSPEKREFIVQIKETECIKANGRPPTKISQCVADIKNLQFGCEYFVLVEDANSKAVNDPYSYHTPFNFR